MIIQTSASNKSIRQSMQALIKSKAISNGYKIPYIKHYSPNEKGSLTTLNIQRLILTPTDLRDKSGLNILNNILKDWSKVDKLYHHTVDN